MTIDSHQKLPLNNGMIAFALPAMLTIETAEEIASEWKQWPLEEKAVVTLDASGVEAITTPGIQMIVSLEKTLSAQGGLLCITGQNEAFARAFSDTGFESLLKQCS